MGGKLLTSIGLSMVAATIAVYIAQTSGLRLPLLAGVGLVVSGGLFQVFSVDADSSSSTSP